MGFWHVKHCKPVILSVLLLSISTAQADPALGYQVVYNGVFSAGADLRIADLCLRSRQREGEPGLRRYDLLSGAGSEEMAKLEAGVAVHAGSSGSMVRNSTAAVTGRRRTGRCTSG